MPAQKSLHMRPRKLTFAKSHALSSNLTLAPGLQQEKRKQKTTLSPGALQQQRSGVSAVKEWGEGFGLDPWMSSEFPRLPLAALHNARGQLHMAGTALRGQPPASAALSPSSPEPRGKK